MNAIGYMPMPASFSYRDVFFKGKPKHEKYDDFSIRHPRMDAGHRAKIFAPFDALKGFNEAVSAKDVLYEDKKEPEEEDKAAINEKLSILHSLTMNSRMAKENRVRVEVTCFIPCTDVNHEAFGRKGQYRTITGICRYVDGEVLREICIDQTKIPFDNILRITIEERWNFESTCDTGCSSETIYV